MGTLGREGTTRKDPKYPLAMVCGGHTKPLKVHAKDAGSYARALLDILFTKEEQLGRCIVCTVLNPEKPTGHL